MDLYTYIAENPNSQQQAINLCYDKGMQPMDDFHLADCLSQIVDNEGEKGLKQIMKIHPDKNVILNYYSIPPSEDSQRVANMLVYKQSVGGDSTAQTNTNNTPIAENSQLQTNIIIFAAAVLIGFAIISKN
jgi:hypothetical protein